MSKLSEAEKKAGRWIAGRVGGTPAVAAYDAAPDNKKFGVLTSGAKKLLNEELTTFKPAAKALIDVWAAQYSGKAGDIAQQGVDGIEADILHLLNQSAIPSVYKLLLQQEIALSISSLDIKGVVGTALTSQVADALKAAIDGARF